MEPQIEPHLLSKVGVDLEQGLSNNIAAAISRTRAQGYK